MKIRFNAQCPYCGFINRVQVEPSYQTGTLITSCGDVEAGKGCDSDYAIKWEIRVQTETSPLNWEVPADA